MAMIWKVRWLRLPNGAPVLWPFSALQCSLLAICGLLISGVLGGLVLRAMQVPMEGPYPPFALLMAITAGSLTTIMAFLALRRMTTSASVGTDPEVSSSTNDIDPLKQARMPGASPQPPATTVNSVPQHIAAGVGVFLLAWPLIQLTAALGGWIQFQITGTPAPLIGHELFGIFGEESGPMKWGFLVAIVLLGPLAEEIVWRGAIQQGLKRMGMPRMGAVIATAILFALFHWGSIPAPGRAAAIPALAVFGFALGFLMERTGGLLGSFTAHSLFNCANIFLFSMLPE